MSRDNFSEKRNKDKRIPPRFLPLGVCLLVGLFFLPACDNFLSSEEEDFPSVDAIAKPYEEPEALVEEQEPEESAEPEDPYTYITISGAGDVTLGKPQQTAYENSFDEVYDQNGPDYFFANVAEIFDQDDLTLVNLEGPLTTAGTMRADRDFNMKGKPEYAQILALGNIEGVGFANNHTMDFLQPGFDDTVNALVDADMHVAYDNVVFTYESQGIQIGVMGIKAFADSTEIEKQIQKNISKLREAGADLVIIMIHGGDEGKSVPEDFRLVLNRKCIDWGADLVLSSHAHVLQGVEIYHEKFIVYGLANFCFGGNRNPSDKDTMIFQQTFVFDENKELTGDLIARVIPCSVSSVSDRNDYRPTPAQGDEFTRILERINELSAPFGVTFGSGGEYPAG